MTSFEFNAIEVKNKLIVLKADRDSFDDDEVDQLGKQLRTLGALGMVFTPSGTELSSLGEKELQNILLHMKKTNNKKVK